MNTRIPVAAVHGRFQPLHVQHLRYLLAALERADLVHVGITQFERSHLTHVVGADEHRGLQSSNPLNYFERAELIGLALEGQGIGRDRFRVSPFPIERPEELQEFLPLDIPILTTRVDSWNDHKIELLKGLGYQVDVLYSLDPKGISGSGIREMIARDDEGWVDLVPSTTVGYLKALELGARLRSYA